MAKTRELKFTYLASSYNTMPVAEWDKIVAMLRDATGTTRLVHLRTYQFCEMWEHPMEWGMEFQLM